MDPAIIASSAGALIPLYRDRLKDTDAAITIRTWALRQCANRPDLARALPLAIASRVRDDGRLAADPSLSIQPRAVTMWSSPSARLGGGRRPGYPLGGVAPPSDWNHAPNPTEARIFLTSASPAGVDEFAKIPAAARQALRPLPVLALPTPAELWKVPATALNPVPAPNQTWNQGTLNEAAKAVVREIKLGRLLGTVPSQTRIAAGLQREKVAEQAFAEQRKRSTTQLAGLYNRATQEFWSVEPPAQEGLDAAALAAYWQPGAAQVAQYKRASASARKFLRLQTGMGRADGRTPAMLYLAAMSEISSGQNAGALEAVDWLIQDYPGYRDPAQNAVMSQIEASAPQAELLQLRLYLLLQSVAPGALAPAKPASPGLTTQTVAAAAAPVAAANPAAWPAYVKQLLRSQPALQLLREAAGQGQAVLSAEATRRKQEATPETGGLVLRVNPTPASPRANGLPSATEIVPALHEALLPLAIAKDGVRPVRAHLRAMLSPAAVSGVAAGNAANDAKYPFAGYAARKLLEIDKGLLGPMEGEAEKAIAQKRWNDARTLLRKIVAEFDGMPAGQKAKDRLLTVNLLQYQDDARLALAQNRFADARALYKRIQAEFPNSAAATQALADFKKTVPVAVTFYRKEGDLNFQPAKQFGVAQGKAAVAFQKMYEEDPTGPEADYALMHWGRAQATTGDVKGALARMQQFISKFPNSPRQPDVLFLKGFYQGSQRDYDGAIATLEQMVAKAPKSPEAPEALWHIAFFNRAAGRPQQGITALKQLAASYPASPRSKHVASYMATLTQASNQN